MESINRWAILNLKGYVGNMELAFNDYDLHIPENPRIKRLFYGEFDKCEVSRQNGFYCLRMIINHSTLTLSEESEKALELSFLRYLLNY